MAKLIIITGPPGSGKTTLANLLAEKFKLPLFSKDVFKCLIADQIKGNDIEYTQSLGRSAIEILRVIVEQIIRSDGSYIIESAFMKEFESDFFGKLNLDKSRILQVYCDIVPEVAYQRIKDRVELGKRHWCHQDHLRLESIVDAIKNGAYAKLDISDTVSIELNEDADLVSLYDKISDFLDLK